MFVQTQWPHLANVSPLSQLSKPFGFAHESWKSQRLSWWGLQKTQEQAWGEDHSSLLSYLWHGWLGVVSFSFTVNRSFLSHFFAAVLWGDTPKRKDRVSWTIFGESKPPKVFTLDNALSPQINGAGFMQITSSILCLVLSLWVLCRNVFMFESDIAGI